MLPCIQYRYSISLLITNPRKKHSTEHVDTPTLTSSCWCHRALLTCLSVANVGVRLLVFVTGDVDCLVLLIYISLSLCPSRQTRSIALVGRSATEKEPARVVNVERSRRVGRTVRQRSYTPATAGETETIYVHVSPYTERTHAEILRTPTGQISTVTRYEALGTPVLVSRRSAALIIYVTLSISRPRARKHVERIINSLFDKALMCA